MLGGSSATCSGELENGFVQHVLLGFTVKTRESLGLLRVGGDCDFCVPALYNHLSHPMGQLNPGPELKKWNGYVQAPGTPECIAGTWYSQVLQSWVSGFLLETDLL